MRDLLISKSKYLAGLQCPKLLWHHYNAKALFPPIDAQTQAIFDEGHAVGQLAKTLFPGGIDLEDETDLSKAVNRTAQLLEKRHPIFEATFSYGPTLVRVDVLNPVGEDDWDIIEVKSSTRVNAVNYHDIAFQRYCCKGAGLCIRRCVIMHINKDYLRIGDVEIDQLLVEDDVTEELPPYEAKVRKNNKMMEATIANRSCPDTPIGLQCDDPYECPLKAICWKTLPKDNVFTLYRIGRKKAFDLLSGGVESICDLPKNISLSNKQVIQRSCVLSGQPYVSQEDIRRFLDSLTYPLYFLDFETFMRAIPPYDYSSPYKQIPFQFSLHHCSSPNARVAHHSFLSDGKEDPRPEFLARLKKSLGNEGSIVAYNSGFEERILRECGDVYPEYSHWVEGLHGRFVDLLQPFRDFSYYHPDQSGSASIKKVLPALTGKNYDGMDITNGELASIEYIRCFLGEVDEKERNLTRNALEEYCRLDTEAMIQIVRSLGKIVG